MEGERPASRRRPLRRVAALLALLAIVAAAIRIGLTVYAADLFVAALGRALSGSGAEVVFDEPPAVTVRGFETKGAVLRSLQGEEWVRAKAVSGSAHLSFGEPWITVVLDVDGARIPWGPSKESEPGPLIPSLPPTLSSVRLNDAVVDLGDGGELSLDATITAAAGGETGIDVERLDYKETSGERAAEKISGVGTLIATGTPRVEIRIVSGAALAGTVLLDFAAHPFSFAAAVAEAEGGAVTFSDAVFAFGKLASGSGSFSVRNATVEAADVRLVSSNLEPAFETLVREPFSGSAPWLADAGLKGRGEAHVAWNAPSRHRADATLTLTLDSLRTRSLEGDALVIELPWIGAEARGSRKGRLRAASLATLGLPWTGIDTALESSPGRIRSSGAQDWKTPSGTLRVTDLVFEDDAAAGPRVSAGLELVGFDLAPLGKTFGQEGLAGSLEGHLGRVQLDADALRTDGAIDIRSFGGSLRVSGLSVEDPFGRVPEIGLDASLREIDLGALTSWLGLGRITGVLEGDVRGLVLAAGQPQAFDADLHTVERRGVSQMVDVRAIVQLGVLGGDTGSLTGSLLKVFDRYRYSKLGVKCRLRNDVFELRGIDSDQGKDYLVKGSRLPPSVSVVSHSQVVSFSEMLRRIQRIAAVDEGGSPNVEP